VPNGHRKGCHDIKYNGTQHNDTQHNDTQHDTQHNDTQHSDTQSDTQHNETQHNDTQRNDTQHNDTQHNDTHTASQYLHKTQYNGNSAEYWVIYCSPACRYADFHGSIEQLKAGFFKNVLR